MSNITVLTRSRVPVPRDAPIGMSYYNHVDIFTTAVEGNVSLRKALDKITTPYMVIVDSDDEMPSYFPVGTKGVVYGDNRVSEDGVVTVRKNKPFSVDEFYKNPFMFHKAIVNVAELKVVMDAIGSDHPHNFYSFHYFFVAVTAGAVYDPEFQPVWDKKPGTMWSTLQHGIFAGVKKIRADQGKYLRMIAEHKKKIGYTNEA